MTPEIFGRQGLALAQQGKWSEALTALDKALQLKPSDGEVLHNRGVVLQQMGRLEDAVASYDRALRTRPEAGTHFNRGTALIQLRRMEEAALSFDGALALAPNNTDALLNRGYVLSQLARLDEALATFEKLLKLKPGLADAHRNRGRILARLGRLDDALAAYDTALQLKPDNAPAWNDRGSTLLELGQIEPALASFERALQAMPDYAEAWHNRGVALTRLNRNDDAIGCFNRVLLLSPDNLATLALKAFQQARICDWTNRFADAEKLKARSGADVIEPLFMQVLDDDPARQLELARSWTAANYPAAPALRPRAGVRPEKLRIGYLSADFRDHPVMYCTAGLFERHDRNRFEIHLFSFGEDSQTERRQRAVAAADRFHDAGRLSDEEVVALARGQGIDIAVDLMGYTKGCRPAVFARRAAPLQVNFLGYPGTMGASFIDHIIADKIVLPESDRHFYAEQIAYLPNSFLPNDDRMQISGRVFLRAELGLPEQGFVFCCFNNNYKISPVEFDIWMRLLARIEGSVLWLPKDNEQAAANLAQEAEARGVARNRLVFTGRVPAHEDYLARHRCADLFLDTFNYNAHSTASDALWAGLPLITKCGHSFPARVAASLLHAVGMPELVTETIEDYEQLAFALATQPERMAAVKAKLEANRLTTPLFNTEAFTRDIEAAYDAMYQGVGGRR